MIFGLKIILLLLLISGSIAYIGDYLGHRIGRKRLSLFGLRPKTTAIIVTIISGALITLTTLGVMLLISRDARTALFGLEELRQSIARANLELRERNKELESKRKEQEELEQKLSSAKIEIKELDQEIKLARQGKVLFRINDPILISLVQLEGSREKTEIQLKQILTAADSLIRGLGVASEKHLIFISPQEFNSTLANLQNKTGEYILILRASQNTLLGEEVRVHFETSENKLIYKQGSEIASADIEGSLSLPLIEQEIKRALSLAHQSAKAAGAVPDPSGSLGSIPYSSIFQLAKKIKAYDKEVNLKILAKEDLYAIGPLEVEFRTYYK